MADGLESDGKCSKMDDVSRSERPGSLDPLTIYECSITAGHILDDPAIVCEAEQGVNSADSLSPSGEHDMTVQGTSSNSFRLIDDAVNRPLVDLITDSKP